MRRWILCLFSRSKVNGCDERPGSALFGEQIGERKAADLDDGMWLSGAAAGRPDAETFHSGDRRVTHSIDLTDFFAGGGLVEADLERVLRAGPAEDVVSGRKIKRADTYGRLYQKIVRVLAFSRVAGGDHDDAGYEVAAAVSDLGGSSELGFDALGYDGRARGDNGFQLIRSGSTPVVGGLGVENGGRERENEYRGEREQKTTAVRISQSGLCLAAMRWWRPAYDR